MVREASGARSPKARPSAQVTNALEMPIRSKPEGNPKENPRKTQWWSESWWNRLWDVVSFCCQLSKLRKRTDLIELQDYQTCHSLRCDHRNISRPGTGFQLQGSSLVRLVGHQISSSHPRPWMKMADFFYMAGKHLKPKSPLPNWSACCSHGIFIAFSPFWFLGCVVVAWFCNTTMTPSLVQHQPAAQLSALAARRRAEVQDFEASAGPLGRTGDPLQELGRQHGGGLLEVDFTGQLLPVEAHVRSPIGNPQAILEPWHGAYFPAILPQLLQHLRCGLHVVQPEADGRRPPAASQQPPQLQRRRGKPPEEGPRREGRPPEALVLEAVEPRVKQAEASIPPWRSWTNLLLGSMIWLREHIAQNKNLKKD